MLLVWRRRHEVILRWRSVTEAAPVLAGTRHSGAESELSTGRNGFTSNHSGGHRQRLRARRAVPRPLKGARAAGVARRLLRPDDRVRRRMAGGQGRRLPGPGRGPVRRRSARPVRRAKTSGHGPPSEDPGRRWRAVPAPEAPGRASAQVGRSTVSFIPRPVCFIRAMGRAGSVEAAVGSQRVAAGADRTQPGSSSVKTTECAVKAGTPASPGPGRGRVPAGAVHRPDNLCGF